MSVCVVVANDDGARNASHALRAAGWGGVHFEAASADAAVRVALGGRATVLNAARLDAADVDAALTKLGDAGFDWRTPPPDLTQDEWAVLFDRHELTPRTAANRLKSATEKLAGASFETWRLPLA